MRESAFSKKVIKRLKAIPRTYVVRTQAGSIGGIPDLLICHEGLFFAWELKAEDGKPTKLQLKVMEQMRASGMRTEVVRPSDLEGAIRYMIGIGQLMNPKEQAEPNRGWKQLEGVVGRGGWTT